MALIPIQMPQLGESIAEAVIVEIDIEVGQQVSADQEIFQVETNKAIMGVTPPTEGQIHKIEVLADQSYPVGATLGWLEISEENAEKLGVSDTPQDSTGSQPDETKPTDAAQIPLPVTPAPSTAATATDAEQPLTVQPTVEGLPVPATTTGATYLSPRMKARMDELGLHAADLSGIAGSGAAGRVTIEDFERFIAEIDKKHRTAASPMRIAVADSMRRSWTRPLATVGSPVRLDTLLDHRKTSLPKPGPTLYIIRALAIALAENTAVAGRLVGKEIVHPDAIDIGFAVEVDDGVMVPVMRDVDKKPLSELVEEYSALVEQARQRRVPSDNQKKGPGIATVTNFGVFGIVWATPIPLPEQNLVLGLGRGIKWPVWNEEQEKFLPATEAVMTLSFDHRILDGGAAGRLLSRISDLLQEPAAL
ncbi:MAG: 2-oxo acid dehydrogenase subunit E2 [Verrucomicrobiales bacterium]|nr:2-oxo acid dehydrogenase subunit E2 [Verrucomicrobiales bacterium]